LIGYNTYNHITQPLDNLLATYNQQTLNYTSSTTLTVSPGSVMVSNSGGNIRLMLKNASSTLLTWSNLDSGSQTSNTTYYVYAIAAANTSTSATYLISASNTAPSGATYYLQIGSFATDSSTNITGVTTNGGNIYGAGLLVSKSKGVTYQALTDGVVYYTSRCSGNNVNSFYINTDSASSPVANPAFCESTSSTTDIITTLTVFVRKGDYWIANTNQGSYSGTVYFLPMGK